MWVAEHLFCNISSFTCVLLEQGSCTATPQPSQLHLLSLYLFLTLVKKNKMQPHARITVSKDSVGLQRHQQLQTPVCCSSVAFLINGLVIFLEETLPHNLSDHPRVIWTEKWLKSVKKKIPNLEIFTNITEGSILVHQVDV